MKLVTLSFSSPSAFMTAVQEVAILHKTRMELEPGETVVMDIRFPGLAEPVVARGTVVGPTDAGTWICFRDRASMEFLKDVASGVLSDDAQLERRAPRFPVDMPASCRIEHSGQSDEMAAEAVDVGPGGAFLRAEQTPAVGSRVRVVLGPAPGTREQLVLFGDVAWTGLVGDDRGFGVQFRASAGDGHRLRQMIRKSRETGEMPFTA